MAPKTKRTRPSPYFDALKKLYTERGPLKKRRTPRSYFDALKELYAGRRTSKRPGKATKER